MAVNKGVGREEVLSLPRRFESLHLPLSSALRSMRVLGSIIQVSTLPMLNVGKQVALGDAVAPQLVGYDHPRHILQASQQSLEEPLGSFGIAPVLHEDVEYDITI